jgi:hypothetical protein
MSETVPPATGPFERRPGRFRHSLTVGPEFFEPLSEEELSELNGA